MSTVTLGGAVEPAGAGTGVCLITFRPVNSSVKSVAKDGVRYSSLPVLAAGHWENSLALAAGTVTERVGYTTVVGTPAAAAPVGISADVPNLKVSAPIFTAFAASATPGMVKRYSE